MSRKLRIDTQWTERVGAERAWPEYPRPQLVRPLWQSLNGHWDYAITDLHLAGPPATWDGQILVPFCVESSLSGVARSVSPEQRLWYRRCFQLAVTTERTLLHFGAVDFHAAIWINGAFVDAHKGGFDAFQLDISDYLRAGDNEIIVAVSDPTNRGDQPRGKQHLKPAGIWYTPVTGIWQTVWLEPVPRDNHIEEVRMTPTATCDAVDVTVFVARPTRDPTLAAQLAISLDGQPILQRILPVDRTLRIDIPDPQRWTPEQPTLYDVELQLVRVTNPLPDDNDDQRSASLWRQTPLRGSTEAQRYETATVTATLDSVRSYFGLRSIRVGPGAGSDVPTLLLNDAPVFQLGVLDQGWWPDGLHTPPCDAAMIFELEFLKSAGFNTVRKHIKVEPARYYYHCDRLGLLVWQDMPSGFLPAQFVAPNDEAEGLRHARSTEQYELELQRMVHRLAHHPSIVLWVLHNEGWGQFATQRLTERIRSLDPSRLVNAASGWLDIGVGDLIDAHDYESTPTVPTGDGERALAIGEYGGLGWPVEGHLWDPEMRNWGYHTYNSQEALEQAYSELAKKLIHVKSQYGVCAAIYTQTTDVEGEVNGFMTYDRAIKKLSAQWLQQLHTPLLAANAGAEDE